MTAHQLAEAQPVSFSAPATIEAELHLSLLAGEDNPLPHDGSLSLCGSAFMVLPAKTTVHTTTPISAASDCAPSFSVVLQSSGHRLLALDLELAKLDVDRIDVRVTSRGILPEHAECLGIATDTYAWRLSTHATIADERLRLTFELVQELGPAVPVAAVDHVRLPFDAGECDAPVHARMKTKPGTGLQTTTA